MVVYKLFVLILNINKDKDKVKIGDFLWLDLLEWTYQKKKKLNMR